MKKLLCISICLLFICVALVPAVVFAANDVADIIYFLNPTALTAVGNNLFVADKIEDGKSVILRYDVTGKEPLLQDMYEVDGVVSNLASKENSGLYAILADKVIEFDTSFEKINRWNIANVIDVAYGADALAQSGKTEWMLRTNELGRIGNNDTLQQQYQLANGIGCITIDNVTYYLYKENGVLRCKSYNGQEHKIPDDSLNRADSTASTYYLKGYAAKGMFVWDNKVALFTDNDVSYIAIGELSCELAPIFNYDEDDSKIVDVATQNGNLYILNDKNKIEVYTQNDAGAFEKTFTVGSDELNQNEPTVSQFTSFTLVESKGYPTNIVFKTTGENSVDNIITDAESYIIIGYEGEQNSNFYYVLLGDTFGWVKKTENAESVAQDERLNIVDTKVSGDGFDYKAKFVSMNAVYVSSLPRQMFYNNENYRMQYEQSAKNKIEVKILQRFTEGETIWYYVSFEYNGATQHGFVRDKDVKVYITTGNNDGIAAIAQRKVNSKLFSTVKVYNNGNPKTMTDENLAYDENEKQIKLSSGTRVTLISIDDNGVAFIQIKKSNVYGYVYANNLIPTNRLTTNATVGLSLLAVALVLGVTLTVVFLRRKRRKQVSGE